MSALNPFLRAMPPRKAHSSGWTSGVIRLRRCFVENTQWISSETYVCDTWHLAQFQASRRDAHLIFPDYPALKRRATFRRPPDAFYSRNGKVKRSRSREDSLQNPHVQVCGRQGALPEGRSFALDSAFWHPRGAMKGNPKVIAELNKALREELTAINFSACGNVRELGISKSSPNSSRNNPSAK